MDCELNIGSNLGDRRRHIISAVLALARELSPCRIELSDYIESEPWGFDSDNRFLNLGVHISTDREIIPHDLLDATQRAERRAGNGDPHRNADGSYRDRPVDIDIIAMGKLKIDTPALTLPHPRAHLRDFVMIPLRQLAPDIYDWVKVQGTQS